MDRSSRWTLGIRTARYVLFCVLLLNSTAVLGRGADELYRVLKGLIRTADDVPRVGRRLPSELRLPLMQLADDEVIERIAIRSVDASGDWYNAADNPRLMSLIPGNDEQYRKVYGRFPSETAKAKLNVVRDYIEANVSVVGRGVEWSDASDVFRHIESSEGRPVVIIAHSEDFGKKVVFPNGESMDVSVIHAECLRVSKRCLVLTCYGDDFGIEGSISTLDALGIWSEITTAGWLDVIGSVDGLVWAARRVRAQQLAKRKIAVSAVVIGSGGAASVVISRYR